MSLNVRKGTQGFIETTRTEPAPKYLGEPAVGDGSASPFSEEAQLVVRIEDDETDLDNGVTVKTFETNTVFAAHARKWFGITDDSLPVEITETYGEYGDSTITSYTDVEVRCGDQVEHIDSDRVQNPLAAMLRRIEHHDKEMPRDTALRLLGQDPRGNNVDNREVVFHYLDGRTKNGTIQSLGGGTVFLTSDGPGRGPMVYFHDLTHIDVPE
jgi:hypothetical protein